MTDNDTTAAAHAWAQHRGLTLQQLRTLTVGQAAHILNNWAHNRRPGATDAIPQHVIRTLAGMEDRQQPVLDPPVDMQHTVPDNGVCT